MQMSSVTKRSVRALGAALLALSSALPAAAQGLIVNTRSSILYFDGTHLYDAVVQRNTYDRSLTPGETVQSQVVGGGTDPQSAIASTRANYGSLGALADVSVSNVTPLDFRGSSTHSRQVLAQAWSSWEDNVSFVNTGAPSGTLVDVRVNLVVDIENISALLTDYAATVASLSFTAHGSTWCLQASSPHLGCAASTLGGLQVGRNEISFDLQVMTGMTHNWVTYMQTSSVVETHAQFYTFDSSASVRAMNTAYSYYTVLTPGATMSWASGHDYSMPAIPEPSTYALMLAGLGLVGWMGRKRKDSKAAAA